MKDGLVILIPDVYGITIPQHFVETFDYSKWNNIDKEDAEACSHIDNEYYWESWERILDSATFTDDNGNIWTLYQDGDLWAICPDIMPDDVYFNFFGTIEE